MTPPSILPSLARANSLQLLQGERLLSDRQATPSSSPQQVDAAKQTREAFTKFIGTTVFGQMLGSMRKTVGEPAYFHGGQAEKIFQGQLDQAIADEMTASGGSAFAQSLFEQQFPDMADVLQRAESEATETNTQPLEQLASLRRR